MPPISPPRHRSRGGAEECAVGPRADGVGGEQERADDGLDVGVDRLGLGHALVDRGAQERGGMAEDAAAEDERERPSRAAPCARPHTRA